MINVAAVKERVRLIKITVFFFSDIEMRYPTKHKEVTENWTGAEESLFRVLSDMYRSNYCAISKLLWNKSCKQVCQMI